MPTPVWFWWDGETLLIYSQPDKPKLRNIEANRHVAVALRTDSVGSELTVISGDAAVDPSVPRADAHPEYSGSIGRRSSGLGPILSPSPAPTPSRFGSRQRTSAPRNYGSRRVSSECPPRG